MINGFKSLYTMHKYKELLYCVRQVERVRSAALGDAGDQRCSRVSAVRGITLYIAVLRIVFDAVGRLPAGDAV